MDFLRNRRHFAAAVFVITLVYAPFAMAHKTSYAYLKAVVAGDGVSGKLELAVRDFDFAFGPGADRGGKVNFSQLHRHEKEISAAAICREAEATATAATDRP